VSQEPLDQDAIDALFSAQSPKEPNVKEHASSGAMSQAEIDAMLSGGSSAKPASDGGMNQAEIDALLSSGGGSSSSGAMSQAEIDAMLSGGTSAKPDSDGGMNQAEIDALLSSGGGSSSGGAMSQAEIDALLANASYSGEPRKSKVVLAVNPDEVLAQQRAAKIDLSAQMLDQSEIDNFLQAQAARDREEEDRRKMPEKGSRAQLQPEEIAYLLHREEPKGVLENQEHPVPQMPNPLGARTIRINREREKIIQSHASSKVTGIYRSRFYTADQLNSYDLALQALQHLFDLARRFREQEPAPEGYSKLGRFKNRRGQPVEFRLTSDQIKPVQLVFSGVILATLHAKQIPIDQVYDVDHFEENSGGVSQQWVTWLMKQFDESCLQELGRLH
jgi:hypothetical protein